MCVKKIGSQTIKYTNCLLQPFSMLAARLYIANIFWKSGLVKIADMETTFLLFENEYAVPYIPFQITAYMATAFELICPILLLAGFATRLAAVPLFAMAVVIQLTVIQHESHFFWMLLTALIFPHGPGALSLDALIKKRCYKP